jgi:aldehyde dehydrogenase (NAD+)
LVDSLIDNSVSLEQIHQVFASQQENTISVRNSTVNERIAKLKSIIKYIDSNTEKIQKAIFSDFKKHPTEVLISEIMIVKGEINHLIKNLAEWAEPQRVSTPMNMFGSSAWVQFESKGNCLIIAPWNYPFNLALKPTVQAIAAGNTVILKPSELTPNTSSLIKEMITELFPENEIAVFEGGTDISTELLALPFNHIFFTGSPNVGKIVMTAAAKNLASVTLELGGKSPIIIDETVNIAKSADKLAWGKLFNNGQTCIAPDYAFVQNNVKDELIKSTILSINKMYNADGQGIEKSESYCRIVNERHFQRVKNLIEDAVEKGAKIVFGGEMNESDRFISPTILENVNDSMKLMQEEIFGPVLPIMGYNEISEVINYVNSKQKPLALYINSKKKAQINYILSNTSAGGTVINDTLMHYGHTELPFGGVNNSGIGKSGGKWGFLEFSNQRAVLNQKFGNNSFIYPPYTAKIDKLIRFFIKYIT